MADGIEVEFLVGGKKHRTRFTPDSGVTGVILKEAVTPEFLSKHGFTKQERKPKDPKLAKVKILDDQGDDVTAQFIGPGPGVCYLVGFELICW